MSLRQESPPMQSSGTGTLHIVICAHPMADLYVGELVAGFGTEEHLIIETYKRRIVMDPALDVMRVDTSSPLRYLRAIRKMRKHVDRLVASNDKIVFYIAHPTPLLSNYVATLAGKCDKVSVRLIPDGIMNFLPYPRRISVKTQVVKYVPKLLAGALCGFVYRPHKGSTIGMESIRYERMYTLEPEFAYVPDGALVEKISMPERKFRLTQAALFLGQPIHRRHRAEYRAGIEKVLKDRRFSGLSIRYKPHPAERLTCELVAFLAERGIAIDAASEPLERSNTYRTVFSYCSSALMNLRMLDKRVSCYAISSRCICSWKSPRLARLRSAFESVGVEFIE